MMDADPGYEARNVLTFRVRLPDAKYPTAADAIGFLRKAKPQLAAIAGVGRVAVTTDFPLGHRSREVSYRVEGEAVPRTNSEWPAALTLSVDESYLGALGIRLIVGRDCTDRDRADSPPVVIVDDLFARRQFGAAPFSEIIGKRIRFQGDDEPWRTIIGVAAHVKHSGLDESPRPEVYRPWTQVLARSPDWLRARM